jgi:hypothetical protein
MSTNTQKNILEDKIIHMAEDYLLVKFSNKETGILRKSKITPLPESGLTNLYRKNQSILVSTDWITEKRKKFYKNTLKEHLTMNINE